MSEPRDFETEARACLRAGDYEDRIQSVAAALRREAERADAAESKAVVANNRAVDASIRADRLSAEVTALRRVAEAAVRFRRWIIFGASEEDIQDLDDALDALPLPPTQTSSSHVYPSPWPQEDLPGETP